MSLNESHVEEAALEWFEALGYAVAHGPHVAPGEIDAECGSFGEVVLEGHRRTVIEQSDLILPDEVSEKHFVNLQSNRTKS